MMRWCWRYGLPLVLIGVGSWLWHVGVHVPDAPAIIPGLYPTALAVDSKGNLYIADWGNECIWKVSRWGKVKRVAGNRTTGYSGDGGQAVKASLASPSGIVLDSEDNLYIADWMNHRIRKVDRRGIITTVGGNGENGFSRGGGQAVEASLSYPYCIAFDTEGNLYIAESGVGSRILKLDKKGMMTTVIGTEGSIGDGGQTGQATLGEPADIAFDVEGNLYIADSDNECVRKVDRAGVVTMVAGCGEEGYGGDGKEAVKAMLGNPVDITFDSRGNLYIGEYHGHRIRKVDERGIITTAVGNGKSGYSGDGGQAVKASLTQPLDSLFDTEGSLYIADTGNRCIRKVDRSGIITTVVTGANRLGR